VRPSEKRKRKPEGKGTNEKEEANMARGKRRVLCGTGGGGKMLLIWRERLQGRIRKKKKKFFADDGSGSWGGKKWEVKIGCEKKKPNCPFG